MLFQKTWKIAKCCQSFQTEFYKLFVAKPGQTALCAVSFTTFMFYYFVLKTPQVGVRTTPPDVLSSTNKSKPLFRGPVLLKNGEPSLRREGINTQTHTSQFPTRDPLTTQPSVPCLHWEHRPGLPASHLPASGAGLWSPPTPECACPPSLERCFSSS